MSFGALHDIERQGHNPTRQKLSVKTITPPIEIADKLKLSPAAPLCVTRQRVRYIDGKPINEQIVRGAQLTESADATREDILAEAECLQTYDIDETSPACLPQQGLMGCEIPAGTPVMGHARTSYTVEDKTSPSNGIYCPRRYITTLIQSLT
ncbi:MAG: UTRA domain-containing protein [Pseudonocardiales bacterium]|nr:UTRA domain-containing protein [Pseudonocardiales bacterium]